MKTIERAVSHRLTLILTLTATALLAGCGGGDGGSKGATLSGVAAVGKPLNRSPVFLKDARGTVKRVFTDESGAFSIDISGLKAPFVLRTQDYGLYSYADDAGVTNLTPFTTMITGIAAGGDLQGLYQTPKSVNAGAAMQQVRSLLLPALQKLAIAKEVDLLHTPFDADGGGLDALLEAIRIEREGTTLTFTNAFTGETVAQAAVNGTTLTITDEIEAAEADLLPSGTLTLKKYFAYVDLDGSGAMPAQGPAMADLAVDGQGRIAATLTFIEGGTGDLASFRASGTQSGNTVTLHTGIILCSDTAPDGSGTADFTIAIDQNGDLSGTVKQTLSAGNTCEGLTPDQEGGYTFTFAAEDVTDATPANVAGKYDVYATPNGNYPEMGPASMVLEQKGSVMQASLQVNDETRAGTGRLYGTYGILRIPVITCNDTCLPDGSCPEPEYATFFGRFQNGAMNGWYGDGVPPGDYCKANPADQSQNPETTDAQGVWRALRR